MQCQICKIKAATVHLTEIVDGKRAESHYCQSCAQKEGITIKSQLSLNELLSSLLAANEHAEQTDPQQAQKSCPICGMTMDMFRKNAVLGCEKDYEIFGKSLEQIIAQAHDGHTEHKGKVPLGSPPKQVQEKNEQAGLQEQLDKAVAQENYELAAELRDKLKKLQ